MPCRWWRSMQRAAARRLFVRRPETPYPFCYIGRSWNRIRYAFCGQPTSRERLRSFSGRRETPAWTTPSFFCRHSILTKSSPIMKDAFLQQPPAANVDEEYALLASLAESIPETDCAALVWDQLRSGVEPDL